MADDPACWWLGQPTNSQLNKEWQPLATCSEKHTHPVHHSAAGTTAASAHSWRTRDQSASVVSAGSVHRRLGLRLCICACRYCRRHLCMWPPATRFCLSRSASQEHNKNSVIRTALDDLPARCICVQRGRAPRHRLPFEFQPARR